MTQSVNSQARFNRASKRCPICNGWDGGNPDCSGYYSSKPNIVFCGSSQWAGSLVRDNNGNYRHWTGQGECKCGLSHLQEPGYTNTNNGHSNPKEKPKPNMNSDTPPPKDKTPIEGWQGGPPPEDWTWEWPESWKVEETYKYKSRSNTDTFEVLRIATGFTIIKNGKPDKTFRQRHKTTSGTYKYSVPSDLVGLYMLPQLLAAGVTDPKRPVIIAEGERKVKALYALGFVATCNPMGADKWKDEYSQELKGRSVFIWPDNDPAGAGHAQAIHDSLKRADVTAHVLTELAATLPLKGDVVDWVKIPGNDAAKLQAELDRVAEANKPPKMLWSLSDLAQFPKPEWLIPSVIKKNSLAFLVGPPKCGKSFYSLMLAMMIASTGGRVIYIGAEDPGGFYERGIAWCDKNKVDPQVLEGHLFFWVKPVALHDEEARAAFIKQVKDEFQPDLILVDTLAMNSFGLDENSTKDMGLYVQALLDMRDETHACIFTIHHTNRAGEYRGSSALPGAADTFMMASQVGDPLHKGGTLKIQCTLQRGAKPFEDKFYVAAAVLDTLVLIPSDDAANKAQAERLTETDREMLSILAGPEGEGGLSVSQLMKLAGWSKEDDSKRTGAYRTMRDLAMAGYCSVRKHGVTSIYTLTAKGRDIVEPSDLEF